jgi:hypothetical protein
MVVSCTYWAVELLVRRLTPTTPKVERPQPSPAPSVPSKDAALLRVLDAWLQLARRAGRMDLASQIAASRRALLHHRRQYQRKIGGLDAIER